VSQRNEREADAFAIDAMMQIGAVPAGAVFYFRAAAYYEAAPGAMSNASYHTLVSATSTHPLAASRIRALADELTRKHPQFVKIHRATLVEQVTRDFEGIARFLDDRDIRNFQSLRSHQRPVATLATCSEWMPDSFR
jgi:predicted Zn-dependent protease